MVVHKFIAAVQYMHVLRQLRRGFCTIVLHYNIIVRLSVLIILSQHTTLCFLTLLQYIQKTDVNKALRFISLALDWEDLRQRVSTISFDFTLVHSERLATVRDIPSPLWDDR